MSTLARCGSFLRHFSPFSSSLLSLLLLLPEPLLFELELLLLLLLLLVLPLRLRARLLSFLLVETRFSVAAFIVSISISSLPISPFLVSTDSSDAEVAEV